MQSLETFVENTIRQGKNEIDNLDEFQQILDDLDTKDKPIYLRYDVISNT